MPGGRRDGADPVGDFAGNGLRLLGSNMGSTRLGVDVPRLVAAYREGRLLLDELITGRYPLERINDERMDEESHRPQKTRDNP